MKSFEISLSNYLEGLKIYEKMLNDIQIKKVHLNSQTSLLTLICHEHDFSYILKKYRLI